MIPNRTELHSPTPLFHLEYSAAHFPKRHDQLTGDGRTQPVTDDLFSEALDDPMFTLPSTIIPKAIPRRDMFCQDPARSSTSTTKSLIGWSLLHSQSRDGVGLSLPLGQA